MLGGVNCKLKWTIIMDNKQLDIVADRLISCLTVLNSGVMRIVREHRPENSPVSHYRVLYMLNINGALPTSEIGKRLDVSRPNISTLIRKLIDEGMVKRLPDIKDRRIVKIDITDKGKQFISERMRILKELIKESLMQLNDDELVVLNISLGKIESIFSRLSNGTAVK